MLRQRLWARPEVAEHLLGMLSRRLRQTCTKLTELASTDVPGLPRACTCTLRLEIRPCGGCGRVVRAAPPTRAGL